MRTLCGNIVSPAILPLKTLSIARTASAFRGLFRQRTPLFANMMRCASLTLSSLVTTFVPPPSRRHTGRAGKMPAVRRNVTPASSRHRSKAGRMASLRWVTAPARVEWVRLSLRIDGVRRILSRQREWKARRSHGLSMQWQICGRDKSAEKRVSAEKRCAEKRSGTFSFVFSACVLWRKQREEAT